VECVQHFFQKSKFIDYIATTILFAMVINGCTLNSSKSPHVILIQYDSSGSRNNLALIIPGMNQTCSDPGYDSIGTYYKSIGITPVYININWKVIGVENLTSVAMQLHDMLKDSFPESHFYLFGFSFGAVISLKLSQLMSTEHILLCSMSPMFTEDIIHQIFPFRQILGMVTDYSENGLSYSASKKKCIVFLYGSKDSFALNKAIIQNRKHFFSCNETIIIPNAKHNISDGSYLKAIQRIVQRIGK
jgi:hypothetical protein